MPDSTFARGVRDGVKGNSAVLGAIQVHMGAFPQPTLCVADKSGTIITGAPAMSPAGRLQTLLDKPNPAMSQSTVLRLIAMYQIIGGTAYLWKQRARDGSVVALWPFHSGQFLAVPGDTVDTYIDHYRYTVDHQTVFEIPASDVIAMPWPFAMDPEAPWQGLSPLLGCLREVMTDNEATRFAWALLRNDAVGSTLWRLPETLSDQELERVKGGIVQRFGGTAKGGPVVMRGKKEDVDVTRLSFNLEEMAADKLHNIPESRIGSTIRVPPILAHLWVGLTQGREGNYESTRRVYHQDTLVPWWIQSSDDLDCGLTEPLATGADPEFGGDLTVVFDTTGVVALQENAADVLARATQQSTAIAAIQEKYFAGTMPRAAAMANLTHTYTTLDAKQIDALLPEIEVEEPETGPETVEPETEPDTDGGDDDDTTPEIPQEMTT